MRQARGCQASGVTTRLELNSLGPPLREKLPESKANGVLSNVDRWLEGYQLKWIRSSYFA